MTDCLVVKPRHTFVYAGDLLPSYVADVSEDGRHLDFTGWTGLTFTLDGPVTVTGSATGDSHGALTYAWVTGNTTVPGDYVAYFRGTSPSPESKRRTFEAPGVFRIVQA